MRGGLAEAGLSARGSDVYFAQDEFGFGTISTTDKYWLEKKVDGKWEEVADKAANLGVKDDAVGLPTAEGSWGFDSFTVEEYNDLYNKLKSGEVVVDNNVDGAESKSYSNVKLEWIK